MTQPPPSTAAARADRVNGVCIQTSLGALLDRVPGSREVVPHLAALERALGALGASAIESIPATGLTRICGQLASLPLPEGDGPLEELQTRLMKALAGTPSGPAGAVTTAARISAKPLVVAMPFVDSRLLSVGEVSMTDFDAAIAAQGGSGVSGPFG